MESFKVCTILICEVIVSSSKSSIDTSNTFSLHFHTLSHKHALLRLRWLILLRLKLIVFTCIYPILNIDIKTETGLGRYKHAGSCLPSRESPKKLEIEGATYRNWIWPKGISWTRNKNKNFRRNKTILSSHNFSFRTKQNKSIRILKKHLLP